MTVRRTVPAAVLALALTSTACVTAPSLARAEPAVLLTCTEGVRQGAAADEQRHAIDVVATQGAGRATLVVRRGSAEIGRYDVDQYYDGHRSHLFSRERLMLRADSVYGCWRNVRLTAPLTDLGFGVRVDEITFPACKPQPSECDAGG